MKYIVLFSTLMFVFSRTAGASRGEFYVEECQRLLKETPADDAAALEKADELMSWISMRHPAIRQLLARSPDLNVAHDLMHLTTGYRLPLPSQRRLFARSTSFAHWDRVVWTSHYPVEYTSKQIRQALAKAWQGHSFDVSLGERLAFTATLLTGSLRLIDLLAEPSSQTALAGHDEPSIKFHSLEKADGRTFSVRIDWARSFTLDELDRISRMETHLEDRNVRSHLIHRMFSDLQAIIDEQQHLAREVNGRPNIEDFKLAYTRIKGGPSLPTERAAVLQRPKPALTDRSSAQPGEAIATFLSERLKVPDTSSSDVSWIQIINDVQQAADVLSQTLFELQQWREDRFEWTSWRNELNPRVESIDRLRASLAARAAAISIASRAYARAGESIARLGPWLKRTREVVDRYLAAEDGVAKLSRENRLALANALNLLPGLEVLLESALASIAKREEVMIKQIGATAQTTLLVAALLERHVREPGLDRDLKGSEEYRRVLEVFAAFDAEDSP